MGVTLHHSLTNLSCERRPLALFFPLLLYRSPPCSTFTMRSLQSLTADLDALSRAAEERFHSQPRRTRAKLTTETRTIFQKYARHGTQARLRHNIKAFLETGEEGLQFAEAVTPPALTRSASCPPVG